MPTVSRLIPDASGCRCDTGCRYTGRLGLANGAVRSPRRWPLVCEKNRADAWARPETANWIEPLPRRKTGIEVYSLLDRTARVQPNRTGALGRLLPWNGPFTTALATTRTSCFNQFRHAGALRPAQWQCPQRRRFGSDVLDPVHPPRYCQARQSNCAFSAPTPTYAIPAIYARLRRSRAIFYWPSAPSKCRPAFEVRAPIDPPRPRPPLA